MSTVPPPDATPAGPTCADLDAVVDRVYASELAAASSDENSRIAARQKLETPRVKAAWQRACAGDQWTTTTIACFLNEQPDDDPLTCMNTLAPDAVRRFEELIRRARNPDPFESVPDCEDWEWQLTNYMECLDSRPDLQRAEHAALGTIEDPWWTTMIAGNVDDATRQRISGECRKAVDGLVARAAQHGCTLPGGFTY